MGLASASGRPKALYSQLSTFEVTQQDRTNSKATMTSLNNGIIYRSLLQMLIQPLCYCWFKWTLQVVSTYAIV